MAEILALANLRSSWYHVSDRLPVSWDESGCCKLPFETKEGKKRSYQKLWEWRTPRVSAQLLFVPFISLGRRAAGKSLRFSRLKTRPSILKSSNQKLLFHYKAHHTLIFTSDNAGQVKHDTKLLLWQQKHNLLGSGSAWTVSVFDAGLV